MSNLLIYRYISIKTDFPQQLKHVKSRKNHNLEYETLLLSHNPM